MTLEIDSAVLLDTAPDCDERAIKELDLQEEDKPAEKINVLEQEESVVASLQQAEVDNSAESGLAEVVSILGPILGQADFGKHDVQARPELDRLEAVRSVCIQPAKPHGTRSTRVRPSWADTPERPADTADSVLEGTVHRLRQRVP